MDDNQQSGAAGQPEVVQTSLAGRLMNVFVAPGEVFAEIKDRPVETANWVGPMVATIIMSIISVMVVFSQPAILQQMKDTQEKAMQEQVAKGKMTQQDADKAMAWSERVFTPTMWKCLFSIGTIVFIPIWLFFLALVLWLVGRFAMGAQIEFMKMAEVSGLALMISALGGIVGLALAVIYGNTLMSPGLILVVGHFDVHNRLHHVLGALNVMNLWYAAVLSVGLGQTTGKGFGRAAAWIFGLWALFEVVKIGLFVHPQ